MPILQSFKIKKHRVWCGYFYPYNREEIHIVRDVGHSLSGMSKTLYLSKLISIRADL
mgnify:CR=1 FL=1